MKAINIESIITFLEASIKAGETTVIHNDDGSLYVFYNGGMNGMLRQDNTGAWHFSLTDSECNCACFFNTVFNDDAKRYQPLLYRLLVAFV